MVNDIKEVLKIERATPQRNLSTYLFNASFVLNLNRFDARSCIQALFLQRYCATFVAKLCLQSLQILSLFSLVISHQFGIFIVCEANYLYQFRYLIKKCPHDNVPKSRPICNSQVLKEKKLANSRLSPRKQFLRKTKYLDLIL